MRHLRVHELNVIRVEVCACMHAQHILPGQRLLADEAAWEPVLAVLKDEEIAGRLRGRWARERGRFTGADVSVERWRELEAEVDKARSQRPPTSRSPFSCARLLTCPCQTSRICWLLDEPPHSGGMQGLACSHSRYPCHA